MSESARAPSTFRSIIRQLATPAVLTDAGPIAARFVYSLRLIALHERVKRDPVPELAVRLGGVDIAAKALALSQTITAIWPETVGVSCFCSPRLTHDEATIAAALDQVWKRDREGFVSEVEGLIRVERIERLWEDASALVATELSAADPIWSREAERAAKRGVRK